MTTSFNWKKKRKLESKVAAVFAEGENRETEDDNDDLEQQDVDWLSAAKRRRVIFLEDNQIKSKRLQNDGAVLAEAGRYWEAMKYWDEAIQLTPSSAVLYEMKSQALLEVGEVFPAVQAAEMAVQLDPQWVVARQTLGRAQIGLGEVHMALSSFQKALHLDPTNDELRENDLKWALKLVKEKEALSVQLELKEKEKRMDILRKMGKVSNARNE